MTSVTLARDSRLVNQVKKEIPNSKLLMPDFKLCTDNAVMVGIASYFHYLKKKTKKEIKAKANLRLVK